MENAIQINQTKNKRNLDQTPKRNYNEAKDEEEVVEYHSSRRSAPQRVGDEADWAAERRRRQWRRDAVRRQR